MECEPQLVASRDSVCRQIALNTYSKPPRSQQSCQDLVRSPLPLPSMPPVPAVAELAVRSIKSCSRERKTAKRVFSSLVLALADDREQTESGPADL